MKKILLPFLILIVTANTFAQKDSTQFVTTWRTTNFGQGGDSTIVIPVDTNYTYNFDVDWNNDGVFDDLGVNDTISHTYPDTGTYTIRIKGLFPRYYKFGPIFPNNKLIALEQWGTNPWLNMERMFWYNDSFTYNAVDTPNLTHITSLDYLFYLNRNFNGDLSNWDVSRIKSMQRIFTNCHNFNQPMANWDVSNVISMFGIFSGCSNFNQPLNNWMVDSCKVFSAMFASSNFNQTINNWNVGNAEDFTNMFQNCPFNQSINNWDVSRVKATRLMFKDNIAFNQPLDNWMVDSITDMYEMFRNSAFNQPLSSWNTSSVTDFSGMFSGNTAFNQDIGNWDIPSNSSISGIMRGMLDNTGMSVANYDSTILKWARQNEIGPDLGAVGLTYCISDSVRNDLINNYFWTITGDTLNCLGVGVNEEEIVEAQNSLFTVYPNPNNGVFTVEVADNNFQNEEIIIYNMQGKLIYSGDLRNKTIINLENMKAGIYLVRVGSETKRVMIQ